MVGTVSATTRVLNAGRRVNRLFVPLSETKSAWKTKAGWVRSGKQSSRAQFSSSSRHSSISVWVNSTRPIRSLRVSWWSINAGFRPAEAGPQVRRESSEAGSGPFVRRTGTIPSGWFQEIVPAAFPNARSRRCFRIQSPVHPGWGHRSQMVVRVRKWIGRA